MWDGLIARQQMQLADFGIPAMFVSNEKNDRQACKLETLPHFRSVSPQLQLKIINVLEEILAAKHSAVSNSSET